MAKVLKSRAVLFLPLRILPALYPHLLLPPYIDRKHAELAASVIVRPAKRKICSNSVPPDFPYNLLCRIEIEKNAGLSKAIGGEKRRVLSRRHISIIIVEDGVRWICERCIRTSEKKSFRLEDCLMKDPVDVEIFCMKISSLTENISGKIRQGIAKNCLYFQNLTGRCVRNFDEIGPALERKLSEAQRTQQQTPENIEAVHA
ncbi:hypothetical protein Trydic_g1622 [Trypoxylus dichotomus]